MVSKPSEVDGCWRLSSSMTLVTAGSCSVDVPTATLGVGSCREGWLDSQASPGLPFPTTHTLVKAPTARHRVRHQRPRPATAAPGSPDPTGARAPTGSCAGRSPGWMAP